MRSSAVFLAATFIASPALADHGGPTAFGSGSMNVESADTLDEGSFSAGLRLSYVRPDQRSDATLAALAGKHVHAHNSDSNVSASAGLAYGATRRLTLSLELPYVRRAGLREGTHAHVAGHSVNAVEKLGSVSGFGDASAIARYKLAENDHSAVVVIGGLKLPTGSTHERSRGGERLETEHQPGTSSFDPIAGAAFRTKVGGMALTASAVYQISGKGAQKTRLGNRAQAGVALSHRFGPADDHHHEDAAGEDEGHGDAQSAAHGHQSLDAFLELSGEWEGRQKVDGDIERDSGGRALWLSPGARFNAANGTAFGISAGVPIAQHIRVSHPENRFRLILSVGRPF